MPLASPVSPRDLCTSSFLAFLSFWLVAALPLASATPPTLPPSSPPTSRPAPSPTPAASADPLQTREKIHRQYLEILRKEIERYKAFFSKRSAPSVYFLRYHLLLQRSLALEASDGLLTKDEDSRKQGSCRVHIALRVGDHSFDQTGPDGSDWKIYSSLLPSSTVCPSELTPDALTRLLWQQTDRHYQIASAQYWRKKYVQSTKPKILDKAGDLSKEPPTKYIEPLVEDLELDRKAWKERVKRISALAAKDPEIIHSTIALTGTEDTILGVDSEGAEVRFRKTSFHWALSMTSLGKNKVFASLSRTGFARSAQELPSEDQLRKAFFELSRDLKQQIASDEGDPDQGPAIVDPILAGAMIYDILMVNLSSQRFLNPSNERTFAKKLHVPILPDFLSIIDDPTIPMWGKTSLNSFYLYDDEWIPARPLEMVVNGVLKNFYLSRKPYEAMNRSNGHGRSAFGYAPFSRPGTIFVHSQQAFPLATLKAMLTTEIERQGRRYGYILTRFSGESSVRRSTYYVKPEIILRLDIQTGKVTLLRDLQVTTDALEILSGILATGNDLRVFNGSDSEDSGSVPISTVAPSFLLRRLVFTRTQAQEKKEITLPPPFPLASFPMTPASAPSPTKPRGKKSKRPHPRASKPGQGAADAPSKKAAPPLPRTLPAPGAK